MWWKNYSQTLFPKNQNWSYLFIEVYQNILKLSCKPLASTSYRAFLKNKKRSETSLPIPFPAWCLNKNISLAKSDQISLSDCLYFLRYSAICVLQLFANQVLTSWVLELTLFSNQAVFSKWPESQAKFFLAKCARKFVQENVKGRGHQGKHWIEQFLGGFRWLQMF